MEDFATLAALAALASQIVTLVKYAMAGQGRQAVQVVMPWVAMFVVLLLGSQADATAQLVLPGLATPLGDLDIASIALAATAVGATGGFAYKTLTAIDSTDSAAEPPVGDRAV